MVSYNQIRKCILVITILLSSAGSISICLCGCVMVCWRQMAEMLSPSYLPYITQQQHHHQLQQLGGGSGSFVLSRLILDTD